MKKQVIPINQIPTTKLARFKTGMAKFDDFVGGGFVPGSAVIFAGEPGVGKSTLWMQIANSLAKQGHKVLYASGEENLQQIRMRADRLKTLSSKMWASDVVVLEDLMMIIEKLDPEVIIVDSLQMLRTEESKSMSGSPTQMNACFNKLLELVKRTDKILIAIGHATKGNTVAGVLRLQHMADVVFWMEIGAEKERVLFAQKNRFGPAQQTWVANMTENGLVSDDDERITWTDENTTVLSSGIEEKHEVSKIAVPSKQLLEILKSGGLIKKILINNDIMWLARQSLGDEKAKHIKSFDIVFALADHAK